MEYNIFWSLTRDTHVAVPDTWARKGDSIEIEDLTEEDEDKIEGIVELDDDEDVASRLLALRTHLEDFESTIYVSDYGRRSEYRVGVHKVTHDLSPEQIMARVAELKVALVPAGLDTMSLAFMLQAGYPNIAKVLGDEVSIDVRNTAYMLVTEGKTAYADAWIGQMPADTRKWHDASKGDYLVLTDDEADDLWDEELERYIDDAMEIPEHLERYFDREKFKADARHDGRGQSLASYDSEEHYVDVNGVTYYIYRTN